MNKIFCHFLCTLLIIMVFSAGCRKSQSASKPQAQDKETIKTATPEPGFDAEIMKQNGEKMAVSNFRIDNDSGEQDLYIAMYSENIDIVVPLHIVRRFANVSGEINIFLGDDSTLKGQCNMDFTFNTDLGKEGIGFADIKELVLKNPASPTYEASSPGKHIAIIYLRDGKQIRLSSATFLASKFDRDPKYQYPHDIGPEYPQTIHFEGEKSGTFYDLAWEQINEIIPLAEKKGLVDCRIIARTGRELEGWANYWWTADRIQGIVPFGKYQLLLIIDYSGGSAADYQRIELQ